MLPTLLHKPLAREVGQPLLTLQSLKIDLIWKESSDAQLTGSVITIFDLQT